MKHFNTADDFLAWADEREGRMGAARIRRFAAALEKGESPPAEDMTPIAAAFRAILDGADPRKALGIEGKKGRREERPGLNTAIAVERLRRAGETRDKARELVGKATGVPYSTVERHHKHHHKVARAIIEVEGQHERTQQIIEEAVRAIERNGGTK